MEPATETKADGTPAKPCSEQNSAFSIWRNKNPAFGGIEAEGHGVSSEGSQFFGEDFDGKLAIPLGPWVQV